jgi:hypothetical protein
MSNFCDFEELGKFDVPNTISWDAGTAFFKTLKTGTVRENQDELNPYLYMHNKKWPRISGKVYFREP